MDEDQSHITARMLQLSLENVYLLTGEDYILLKSSGGCVISRRDPSTLERWNENQSAFTEALHHPLISEKNVRKILLVIHKITLLLTGEEWEYLEEHKANLYNDIVMENQPPLTSLVGARNKNPPERLTCLLYSRDCTQEDETIPHHYQKVYEVLLARSGRLDEERFHVRKRILQLTLEIIYLLTGEVYTLLKSSEQCVKTSEGWNMNHSPVTVPLSSPLTPKKNKEKKILKVTSKMIELLTGEVPLRCQDVTVHFSMEEWQYLEGHRDLYKDAMTGNQPPLTSLDGSSNGSPSEQHSDPLGSARVHHNAPQHYQFENRITIKVEDAEGEEDVSVTAFKKHDEEEIPKEISIVGSSNRNLPGSNTGPLYFQNCTQEGYTIPNHYQFDNRITIKVEDAEEEEDVSFVSYRQRQEDKILTEISIDGSSNRNPAEKCTGPLYSQHWPQEDHNIPQHYQLEDWINIEVVDVEEEALMRSYQQCKVEGNPIDHSTGRYNVQEEALEGGFMLSEGYNTGNSEIMWQYPSEISFNPNIYPGPHSLVKAANSTHFVGRNQLTKQGEVLKQDTPCPVNKPFSCPECGRSFAHRYLLVNHQKLHRGEKPFPCPQCGKCFTKKAHLERHNFIHTGEKPFSCPLCKKPFSQKCKLVYHLEDQICIKPFPCIACNERFSERQALERHMDTHPGRFKPYGARKFSTPRQDN
ncbi:gastrula zinc finger protein XlCGF53.1-like isoform X2 [Hyperolius riggenbachi]|uniref:gastrula zinc finger protein XlCGF53.1-like isoform X2 n=1 Tax=Hyperolius riggenbachi TaxID=752182 RepID=UPI0035A2F86C